jgi:hypothetical protein
MHLDKIHQPPDHLVVYWGHIQAWFIGSAAAAMESMQASLYIQCCAAVSCCPYYMSPRVLAVAPCGMELHMAALQGCLLYPTSTLLLL